MDNNYPWAVFRLSDDRSKLELVKEAEKLQDARYWLMYIGTVGDALFRTAKHPRYSGTGDPTYEAHLESRQHIEHNEAKWRTQIGLDTGVVIFDFNSDTSGKTDGSETSVSATKETVSIAAAPEKK